MKHLPNLITFSRILVLALLFSLAGQTWTGAATIVFFSALYGAISDFLDGYFARKYNAITNFGKIADAIVDKVMVLGSYVLLMVTGLLSTWWPIPALVLFVLIAARELGVTGMRMLAARKGIVLAAEKAGKRKTIWQITSICVLFAVPMFERDFATWLGINLDWLAFWILVNGYLYFLYASWLTVSSGSQLCIAIWSLTAFRRGGQQT
ncbi:MAG: CDP-alcohol phosphatidyltransferase family protein [Verrucomicrobia bacterium]|nr:CDP-alcohol phosphatidyltransferase family protein [Verrucomicrobiota bacterium]